MSEIPVESTPATNTRRRATDRRARAESSSSIESDRPDATVVRRKESDSALYVRLHHRDSDPPRHANSSPTADATLLVPKPSNPPPRLGAVGVVAADEATLVSASRAGRQQIDRIEIAHRAVCRSIRRDDCRLRPSQSSRAIAI